MATDAGRLAEKARSGLFKRLWSSIRRWWRAHFSGVEPKEKWGYGIWGFLGVLVGVPELWAAIDEESCHWPTISGTVGEIEYQHPEAALAVVALVVLSAYSALRYPSRRTGVLPKIEDGQTKGGVPGDPDLPNRTQEGGRLTRSPTPVREISAGIYFAGALAVIAVCTAVAILTTDVDDEHTVGRTLYGLTALLWVVVPSAAAWPKRWAVDVPFPTLFQTIRSLEERLRVVALTVATGLAILMIHLVLYPWPDVIPDLQDLHEQSQQGPQLPVPAEQPPSPTAP